MSRVPVDVGVCQLMMYSNVIVGITISRGSFVFNQSRVKVSTSLTNIGSLKARINDCHRRLNYCNNKLQQQLDKLKQLLPTNLFDTVMTIADRRADKTTDRVRTEQERKLTRLQRNKDKRRPKTDDNWVRNISSRPLDKTETRVLSYGLKHSVTPKRIPTKTI